MNITFRTDASLQIGSGHVMRCLTLADELRQRGADTTFVCREHPGNLIGLIEEKGYPVIRLQQPKAEYVATTGDVAHAAWLGVSWQQDAAETITAVQDIRPQWLIVDHYAICHQWEEKLRPYIGKIMVIDDLADRPHDCNILLDQNLFQDMDTRYDRLVSANCKKLLGPGYALLRPEFLTARNNLRQRDGQVRRVLVFCGGVDPTNTTEKALQALARCEDQQFEIDVVVGAGNPHKERIKSFCTAYGGFHYHCQVSNMAELMVKADLAIGAGGATTWERCFLGLPSLVFILAENQRQSVQYLASLGVIISLGEAENVSVEIIYQALQLVVNNNNKCIEMSMQSLKIINSESDTILSIYWSFYEKYIRI